MSKTQEAMTDRYPNSWVPAEKGDSFTGEIVDITRAWSDPRAKGNNGNGWYPLLHIRNSDGEVKTFHAFQTVALNKVAELRPLPGEVITITYAGEGRAKEGQSAPKLFRLSIEGRDPVQAAQSVYDNLFGAAVSPVASQAAQIAPDADTEEIPF